MTIGIYAIYWEIPSLLYVGQSVDINRRIQTHKYKFNKQEHIQYLQETYNKYGIPEYLLIEECEIPYLDNKESFWIQEFDTINRLTTGQAGKIGYESSNCIATKEQLLLVARLLCNPSITDSEIQNITKVSSGTIASIKYRKRHSWISEADPETWDKLNTVTRFSEAQVRRFNSSVVLKSPEGESIKVNNITKFAKEYGLNKGHLAAVCRGAEIQHKGWTLISILKGASDE
jgi:group I intron endonuclease